MGEALELPVAALSLEPTRRRLSARQARTVQKLTVAVVDELNATGYDGLTIRNVARRAGVAPATAYTYFTSREHLVTEVFWRRLEALAVTAPDPCRSRTELVSAALDDIALLVADEPELAAACSAALLAPDPDVKHLRDRIGIEVRRRLLAALDGRVAGELTIAELATDPSPELLTLELALFGSLVQAGMGHLAYDELPALLAGVVDLVIGGHEPGGASDDGGDRR